MNLTAKNYISCAAAVAVFVAVGCSKAAADAGAEAKADAAPAVEAPATEAPDKPAVDDGLDVAPPAQLAEPAFAESDVLVEAYGEKLTYADVVKLASRMLKSQGVPEEQIAQIIPQMATPAAIGQMAEQFVVTAALKDTARKAGFTADEASIKEAFSNIVERLPPGVTFEKALEQSGTTEEEARKQIAENIPIQKFFESLCKDTEVSDEDVAKFYEENIEEFETPESIRASHILVKVESATNEVEKAAAKAKIEGLLKQVREGADFAELAKANSDCPSKEQGGDLGFFGKGAMVPAFEKAAFALETNQVSDVVETPFGFHIIKLIERKAASKEPLEKVAKMIKSYLENQAKGAIVESYVEGLVTNVEYKAHEKLDLFSAKAAAEEAEEEAEEAAVVAEEAAAVAEVAEEVAEAAAVKAEVAKAAAEAEAKPEAPAKKACACAECKTPDCDKAACACPAPAAEVVSAPAAAPEAAAPEAAAPEAKPAPAAEAAPASESK